MENLVFLQVDYAGYPAGTPLVEAEKSTAHHQASAMVGGKQVPTIYCKLVGTEGPATLAIPLFEGIVEWEHPTDPKFVGPFVCVGLGRVVKDKLPTGYAAYITAGYDYPFVKFNVCVNTEEGGEKVRVELPRRKVVNFREEVEKYLESLKDGGKNIEAVYMGHY